MRGWFNAPNARNDSLTPTLSRRERGYCTGHGIAAFRRIAVFAGALEALTQYATGAAGGAFNFLGC